MGFLDVGEGCGIVVNDTAATKLNGLNKKLCPLQPSLSLPGKAWVQHAAAGAARWGSRWSLL